MEAFALLLFSLFLLNHSLSTTANIHKKNHFRRELISHDKLNTTLLEDFEVTKPVQLPNTKPCSYLLLQHDFGFTFGSPPVLANYTPPSPSNCPSQNFDKIVFQWEATCKGVQYDRIFGVWLGGVELLRSCTAEPTSNGIIWTVKKDITRYYSLLMKKQTLAVFLGTLINNELTGVYHVNITFHFYPAVERHSVNPVGAYGSWADLILPISRTLPVAMDDGLWFEINNSTDIESKKFVIPQNAYKAVLEVYVSFHESDEFWYTEVPTNSSGSSQKGQNGPFREVVVTLDGTEVGAVWPFTVIYTGGISPILWIPITGIGSFDLPSYDIQVTPFLGEILDGKTHEFAFSVPNGQYLWLIDANLHVWLDKSSEKTEGQLLRHYILPSVVTLVSTHNGINGTLLTTANKTVSSVGWVKSSYGNITTNSTQRFSFSNFMVVDESESLQSFNQIINFNDSVHAKLPNSSFFSIKSSKRFLLYSDFVDLALGFNEKLIQAGDFGSFNSSLKNIQNGQIDSGSTQQVYRYKDSSKFCYFRNVSSLNTAIVHDRERETCSK